MVDSSLERPVFVYKIRNLVNGKQYIGITYSPEQRKKQHFWRWNKETRGVRGAIKKYGPDNFVFEVLHEAPTANDARLMECQLIAEYGTMAPNGYNLTSGGEAGGPGIRVSDEIKKIISEKAKAQWADPARRAIAMAAAKNKVYPESHFEHLRKQAALKKGVPRSRDAVEKGRAKLMGHGASEETRAKLSASGKGKHAWTQEMKDRQSAAIKARWSGGAYDNKVITPEHRAAMSLGRVGLKRGPYKKKAAITQHNLELDNT